MKSGIHVTMHDINLALCTFVPFEALQKSLDLPLRQRVSRGHLRPPWSLEVLIKSAASQRAAAPQIRRQGSEVRRRVLGPVTHQTAEAAEMIALDPGSVCDPHHYFSSMKPFKQLEK